MSKRSSKPTIPAVPSRMVEKPTIPNTPTADLAVAHERAIKRERRGRRLERAWRVFITIGALGGLIDLALRIASW